MKKALIIILASLTIYSCTQDSIPETETVEVKSNTLPPKGDSINVAFLIMDGVFNTELTAPFDIFHHQRFRDTGEPMRVFTLAEDAGVITTYEGLKIEAKYGFEDVAPTQIDLLVIPSAEHHMDSDLENKKLLEYVRAAAANAKWVMSLCDGAFVLAEAGVLDSVRSTTFPGDIEEYKKRYPHLEVVDSVLFVQHGKFITSAGGAKSFEPALYLLEHLYGKEAADKTADGMVIDWNLRNLKYVSED